MISLHSNGVSEKRLICHEKRKSLDVPKILAMRSSWWGGEGGGEGHPWSHEADR